jgi:acyl-CoA synthetase (AMP-forming)/AMP-acid ligase II
MLAVSLDRERALAEIRGLIMKSRPSPRAELSASAAVIPLPGEEAGEAPKAFVVTNGSITPEDVSQFVADHVAPYKKVRAVEIVSEVPKSPSGKILRRVLIERERDALIAR